jgi:hypothetical protein
MDFVMWKPIVSTVGDNGPDSVVSSWKAIFRDARPGKDPSKIGHYFTMNTALPNPNSVSNSDFQQCETIFRAQKMTMLDGKMECNNSVSFALGTSGAKAGVSGLAGASGMNDGSSTTPPAGDLADDWEWLENAFKWESISVPANKVNITTRSGRNSEGNAAIGTSSHPFWHVSAAANGCEIWDDRPYGFGQQDITP